MSPASVRLSGFIVGVIAAWPCQTRVWFVESASRLFSGMYFPRRDLAVCKGRRALWEQRTSTLAVQLGKECLVQQKRWLTVAAASAVRLHLLQSVAALQVPISRW